MLLTRERTTWFHEMREIAWRAEGVLASQEEFCPVELLRFSLLCYKTGNGKPEG